MREFIVVRDEEACRTVYVKEVKREEDAAKELHYASTSFRGDRYDICVLYGSSWKNIVAGHPRYGDGKPK